MARFSVRVVEDLRVVGWTPGRVVEVGGWQQRLEASGLVRMHPTAAGFLGEFGGLKVEMDGPGVSAARQPFELDPDLAEGEEDRFAE
ncbi:SUKH-3 domain-containing protein [Amycolatopsis mediterranei]|uniref:SUKH-3 domain-containing protein n=1 Tax=Amycolatopsis mediterranei TaxID=33910 RepID=UPI00342D2DDC